MRLCLSLTTASLCVAAFGVVAPHAAAQTRDVRADAARTRDARGDLAGVRAHDAHDELATARTRDAHADFAAMNGRDSHADLAADPHWSDGYTLVVLDSGADLDAARRLVQARGGTVALLLPPCYLTGWIPPALDAELVGHAGIRSLHRGPDATLDALAPAAKASGASGSPSTAAADRAALRFFARATRGELDAARTSPNGAIAPPDADGKSDADAGEILRPDALPRGDISEFEIAANLARQGIFRKGAPGGSLASNSDFMTGTVSVTIFFVESDGSSTDANLYDWTENSEGDTFDDAAAGLSWWVAQAKKYSNCWVTFRLQANYATADARCSQWREPVLHSSSEWSQVVQEVLGNYGYTVGGHMARAAAFDAAMRVEHKTDWAYSAFVGANAGGPHSFTDGYAAWAYIGGPYISLLQKSFGWAFKQVFTHETAHMFRACDEYYTPGYGGCTGCSSCADTGVPNGNCEECNANAVSCMMRANTFALCNYTAGQIGWWRTPCSDHDLPAPRLDAAEPAELAQGAEADVLLHGDFFASGAQASLGVDVEVVSTDVVAEDLLRVHVRVGLEAAPGGRDVVVTGPDGQDDLLAAAFRVRATPRHYVSSHGANVFPYDRPDRAAVAFATALAACSEGDTLLLAGGTYAPIALHKSVTLVGGWADDFGSRGVAVTPTIVLSTGGQPAVMIDGATSHPVLDGLVLRGGTGQIVSLPQLGNLSGGGGILVVDASPTLRGCTLENNTAGTSGSPGAGGGGFFWRGHPRLESCVVRDNHAARGAGLFFLESDATLLGNTIETNDAGGTGLGAGIAAIASRLTMDGGRIANNVGAQDGGGVHLESCSRTTLRRVRVDANVASRHGGGIASSATRLDLVACSILGNTAGQRGGGVHSSVDSIAANASLFAGNHAAELGGGLDLEGSVASIVNATLTGNDGGIAGAIFWLGSSAAGVLRASIIANHAGGGMVLGGGAAPSLDWNLFWENAGNDHIGVATGLHDLEADPGFAASGDFRLGIESPALDSGDADPARNDPDGSPNDRGAYGGPNAWPAAPPRIDGLVVQARNGSNRLTWNPSRDPGVASYVVYRDVVSSDFLPTAAQRMVLLAAPTTSWTDDSPVPNAWYRIVAVDTGGHASGASLAAQASPTSDANEHAPAFALHRIAPNPANPGAWIEFELPAPAMARLAIYDSRGRRVRALAEGAMASGVRRLYWDGHDDGGRAVASGVYWVQLVAGAEQRTAKIVVVR